MHHGGSLQGFAFQRAVLMLNLAVSHGRTVRDLAFRRLTAMYQSGLGQVSKFLDLRRISYIC